MTEPNGHSPDLPEWEVVARLTTGERVEAYRISEALNLLETQRRLMQAGSQQFWTMIRQKYDLPPDSLYDPPSGAFVRRSLSSPAGEPAEPSVQEGVEAVSPLPSLDPVGVKPSRKRGKRGRR